MEPWTNPQCAAVKQCKTAMGMRRVFVFLFTVPRNIVPNLSESFCPKFGLKNALSSLTTLSVNDGKLLSLIQTQDETF